MKKGFLTYIIFLLAWTSLSCRNCSSAVVAASDPDPLEVQWSCSIGCEDRCGPGVGPDGVIYVGGHSGYIPEVIPDGMHKWKFKTKGEIPDSAAIAPDSTIYAYADFKYHAIKSSRPLAGSSWPTMGGNNYRSGRISDY